VRKAFRGLLVVFAALGVSAPAAHASLTVPFNTFTSLPAFEAAAGGADNGTTPAEQSGGFRHFSPTGIAVDGSDPGSAVIPGGHTAALSRNRLQPWGIGLGPEVAVANDGFKSVNPNAGFTPSELWAPFNSNTTTLQIVAPGTPGTAAAAATTRGLGITFANVAAAGATIQYFSGNAPLLPQPLQVSTSFAGVLFRDPVVTSVVVTLGTAEMFGFDGSHVTQGTTASNTLAAGDDIVQAEPGAGQTTLAATAGVPISPVLEHFDSTDSANQITATIDWGDGTRSNGSIVPAAGGFAVTGNHAYARAGSYTANVTVDDFGGSELTTQALVQVAPRATATSLACSPAPVTVSAGTVCTAAVQDLAGAGATAPTGVVTFSTATPGATFAQGSGCTLGPTAVAGVSVCNVRFVPGQLPPSQARVAAAYAGDDAHGPSNATATVGVRAQRCSLQALTRRLRSAGLGILVTCDAQSGVEVGVKAQVGRRAKFRPFSLTYGTLRSSVTAGRPTVLVVKPGNGVLKALRDALRHHQRVSLKVTLTASARSTQRTTTTRVSALRIS
jgi:hypothetical protein